MYVVAIKDTRAWVGYSAAELSLVGFWNLIIVWLKVSQTLCILGICGFLSFNSFFYRGVSSGYGH
jgi:hypothetical protein